MNVVSGNGEFQGTKTNLKSKFPDIKNPKYNLKIKNGFE